MNSRKGGEKRRKVIVEGGEKKKKKKQGEGNAKEGKSNRKGTSGSPSKSRRMEMGEGETAEAEASSLCSFPMRRVRRLVRGEAAAGSNSTPFEAAARTTNDAVFLINKASELFLQRFAQDSFSDAVRDRQKSLAYHHLSSTVCNGKRYEFLSDFVPQKVKAEEALKAKALVET